MFISKKHLTRRMVLRGLGSSVALPLLDAMIPAATVLAQTAAAAPPKPLPRTESSNLLHLVPYPGRSVP